MRPWTSTWLVLTTVVLVAACTGPDDTPRLTISSPVPRPPAAASARASAGPKVAPDVRRAVAWELSAGTAATQSIPGGLTIYLDQMSLTRVERFCDAGVDAPRRVCAGLGDDARTVMAVDAVVVNQTGTPLVVRPAASAVVLDGERVPASTFAGVSGPTVVDDVAEGQLQWVLAVSVDDLRDRGGVEVQVAVPPLRGASESRNRMVVFVVI